MTEEDGSNVYVFTWFLSNSREFMPNAVHCRGEKCQNVADSFFITVNKHCAKFADNFLNCFH